MTTFRQRVGVNIHSRYPDYKTRQADLAPWLAKVGFGFVRDNNPAGPTLLPGMRVQVVIDTSDPVQAAKDAAAAVIAGAWRVECKNEPTDIAAAKAIDAAVVGAVAGRIPVVQSALGQPDLTLARALGPTPGATLGNIHCYRANRPADQWTAWQQQHMAIPPITARFLPWMVSETGAWYSPTPVAATGHTPTPPDIWAAQIVPDLIGWLTLGATEVCYYEAFPEPSRVGTLGGHFGLENTPAETALTAFLAEFGDYTDLAAITLAPELAAAQAAAASVQQELAAANGMLAAARTALGLPAG